MGEFAASSESAELQDAPPPVDVETVASSPPKRPKPDKRESDDDDGDVDERRSRAPKTLPKELQDVKNRENATLRDIANAMGADGTYKIRVSRIEPQQFRDPATGRVVQVGGFLRNYQTPVDEEILAANHGGGKFSVNFQRRNDKGGFVFFTQKTIDIVGDPRTDDTFRQPLAATAPAPAPTPSGENPALIKEAFGVLKEQLEHERGRPAHDGRATGPDPGMIQVIEILKAQLLTQSQQLDALRKELTESRNQRPVEDPMRAKMFEALLDGDSARVTHLRTTHDSELRMLKENHREDEKRMRDAFERDKADLKSAHDREISLMRQTNDLQLQAAKASFETSKAVLEADNRRLQRENDELKSDNKELRAKKEKGPLEIVKEADQIKEVLGVGDGDDKSGWEKAAEMLPSAIEAAKSYFKPGGDGQQQQAAQGGQQQALQPKRKVVVDKTSGQRFILEADGTMSPAKKKPPPPPQPGPNGEPPIPQIAPETISTIINYLERAFTGNQEAEVVAQSGRAMVPEEIVTAIRDHGVDGFLSKVAKLPSTSPLSNQAGRNWMRKVGKALVGE